MRWTASACGSVATRRGEMSAITRILVFGDRARASRPARQRPSGVRLNSVLPMDRRTGARGSGASWAIQSRSAGPGPPAGRPSVGCRLDGSHVERSISHRETHRCPRSLSQRRWKTQ